MSKHNASNVRIKREYFNYLKQAKGRDAATIDAVAKSLVRFEESTGWRDFKRFHRGQAIAFKTKLGEALNARTRDRLSKSTLLGTLRNLREFFFWLAHQPGFKSHIGYADADYFSLSGKEVTVARAIREKSVPTLEQVERVLSMMPARTALERRDRALIALTTITGARIGALASFRHGHVSLNEGCIVQDGRTVQTKFGKTFSTFFLPVSQAALAIFADWHKELERDHLWGPADPLFPATKMTLDQDGAFAASGLCRRAWSTTGSAREIFKRAFAAAGLPYYNPHTFRDMLVRHAFTLNLSPEQMKAWSQNLGHADVLTTFTSYGQLPSHRQGQLIRESVSLVKDGVVTTAELAAVKALIGRIEESGLPR